ncbi:tetratricopeptide repeat protein [Agriterribacter sp.]|uniref:tetratricopeptide repeat protein n=1 Tax=Agriterribacter sp. TaxID=2821509 RepID=UPI002BCB75B6|nr:DUF5107 domain-containing protein [Agriterribacter sp.]HTN06914.1 DUF5107 domain-containing protein [Agriterribacter sp.]
MNNAVRAWEELITIPTYKTGEPDKHPMFLEKRVYQGSSGVVYPNAVIDKIFDDREDKIYKALYIENEYLKIMILPELGGRIQMAYDKTNNYHFIYYNQVIKPALVGLTGPWVSGGIEFNWPQHHRPSTFEPIDYAFEEHDDGSKTVWVSEIEKMFHTKGMAGFRLYPGKAYIEVTGKLYNRTALPQTFLWWANPAVAADEHYQSIFPPDVHAVYDHGKRDVSSFPVATGTYYKVDYSPGTDISWYKHIPVPTSYMAVNSEFDFVGGYHHVKKAGLLHVADHHISPGKKQWTWGCGDFGKAWDRHLTDEDGPYLEIMTGVFTDNQPDFGWIMPNEERSFRQYFLPYKAVGNVKNATKDALINLEVKDHKAVLKVYLSSARSNISIQLLLGGMMLFEATASLSPVTAFEQSIDLPEAYSLQQLQVIVKSESGEVLVSYVPVMPAIAAAVPDPAKPLKDPADMETNEALYMAGLHLEQYRHATFSPVPYYEEALRRDGSDIRNNNALGLWYFRRGQFAKAESHFQVAVASLLVHNPNPYDGEPLYNLGLSFLYQDKKKKAYESFFKSCWNAAWQDNGYLQLARMELAQNNIEQSFLFIEKSLARNNRGIKSRHLKTILLRYMNRLDEAKAFAVETLQSDAFDFGSSYERFLILQIQQHSNEADLQLAQLKHRLRNDAHTFIEIAIDYAWCGRYEEAIAFLLLNESTALHPLNAYYIAYYYFLSGNHKASKYWADNGFAQSPDRVFPNRLEDIAVLKYISQANPADYKVLYYLGNLWYDKRQYSEAIDCWERSYRIHDRFASVMRNLGIACYNRLNQEEKALQYFEKAFLADTSDARVLFELDQLYKKMNYGVDRRFHFLKQYFQLVLQRDDLYIELVTLYNLRGEYEEAMRLLNNRKFHPWEGGEGKITGQYVQLKLGLAKRAIAGQRFQDAIQFLEEARVYPENLGEGKLPGIQENDILYWLGIAHEYMNNKAAAEKYWMEAAVGIAEPAAAIYYNDAQPDKIFYQGLALLKLQRAEEAHIRFNRLVGYGEQHMHDEVKMDYFAVSLPGLLIFNDDLNMRNRLHCHYVMALGYAGMGETEKAVAHFNAVIKIDISHQGANVHLEICK